MGTTYRLRCTDIGPSLPAQIRAFLAFSLKIAGTWEFKEAGEGDAWLEPLGSEPGLRLRLASSAGVQLRLSLPLQFEDFIDALTRAETILRAAPASSSRPTPAALPEPGLAAIVPTEMRPQEFRLRRWPPAELLMQHKYHPRLASFLSMRPLSLAQLSAQSNVAPQLCEHFLRLVLPLGIVESRRGAPAAASSPAPTRATAVGAAPQGGAEAGSPHRQRLGVVQRLRQRLGIGASE